MLDLSHVLWSPFHNTLNNIIHIIHHILRGYRNSENTISMIFLIHILIPFLKYKIVLFCLFGWLVGSGFFLIEKDVSEYFSHLSVIICF